MSPKFYVTTFPASSLVVGTHGYFMNYDQLIIIQVIGTLTYDCHVKITSYHLIFLILFVCLKSIIVYLFVYIRFCC